ncbi:MAG: AmmeMemoRadiSam system protein B, partial [Candidatus Omnitrophica bacterium]|nr:AmmeMemoRadiSam system protein B [Candidatus Omnitrophota bacterium]
MGKRYLFIISVIIFAAAISYAAEVKEPDLAGSWYSASKTQLEKELKSYLDAANPPKVDGNILALIVPHAGYAYSGPIAAYGYKAIMDSRFRGNDIVTVIILGFSHRKYFDGVSVYGGDSWKTPLGEIAVDTAMAQRIISSNPRFRFQKELFDDENSVEMQVPFVQAALGKMGQSPAGTVPIFPKIVPVAFGNQNYSDVHALAVELAEIIKEREKEIASAASRPRNDEVVTRPRNDVLIIASTDLSHFHPYQDANSIDKRTIDTLSRLKAKEFYDEAKMEVCELCGLMPVTTSLLAAEMLGYDKIKTLKYANSGDISGDNAKVVGYVSAVLYKDEIASAASRPRNDGAQKVGSDMLDDVQRKRLLQIARESITSFVKDGKRKTFTETDAALNKSMGAFVTLHEGGELRGCIGNMVGRGPLYQTIADMAIEAATGDPRFQKLSPGEIDKINLEISVLSPLQKVKNVDEIKIPGHGVIVKSGFNSGVYLPQVATETGWSREEFLTSLCAQKAGLRPDAWK